MYFRSRLEAGQRLASLIVPKYQGTPCVVMSLSNGGVIVGSEIAKGLACKVTMLLTEAISLPREIDPIGSLNQEGGFSYNSMFSAGQLEEWTSEYRNLIDQERLEKMHSMNKLLGDKGVIDKTLLRNHNVVLVSDGLVNGFSLDAAAEFLKPLKLLHLIIASPIATVQAVDRMHVMADDIYCLSILENYISTNHYYEQNDVPNSETLLNIINKT
jgi:putative phosphoribosyl transferase